METLKVIKIGGNVIDKPDKLEAFLKDFASIDGPKILVHGGGAIASSMLTRLDIEPKMIEGRRVTDAATLDVVTMVYAGLVNKNIVATLQKFGCNSVGLSGADCNCIVSDIRPKEPIDYGFVGDLKRVSGGAFAMFLEHGITPVVCAINHDGCGTLLNTNADTIATGIATALSYGYDTELIFCFEKDGVLYDKDDETSVIEHIDKALFETLKAEGRVAAGMLPKLKNAFEAIEAGVGSVIIKNSDNILCDKGTIIK